jgi:transposase InsO family protein
MPETLSIVHCPSSIEPAKPGIWIDLETAAKRSGLSAGHLARRCRLEWSAKGQARLARPPEGGKSCYYIRADADPAFASVKFPEQMPFDPRGLNAEQRADVFDRRRILDNWQTALRARFSLGFTEAQVTEQFLSRLLADEGRDLSPRTLFRWQSNYRAEGMAGLVDRRGQSSASATDSPGCPFLEAVEIYYLTPRKLSKKVCWEMAMLKAQENSWLSKGYRATCLHLDKLDPRVVTLKREGVEKYKTKMEPSITRDYTNLHTNEQWVGDHHQCDLFVIDPNNAGKFVRPWLTAWEDMRSRKIVGWCIAAHDPNQNSILSALRSGILANGIPELLYVDNGKDFGAKVFHGTTKLQRRTAPSKLNLNTTHIKGILEHLQCEARFAWPYHGQSKPIEPWFGTLEDRFCRTFATYCGNTTEHKPEDLQRRLEKGEAPTLAELTSAFEQWLEHDYNAKAGHSGQGMEGRSPNQAFDESWNGHAKRTTSEGMIDLLLMKSSQTLRVRKNGVTFGGLQYGQFVLAPHFGKEVYLRIDERDISRVLVFDITDRFICAAPVNRLLPANATEQEKREALAEHKHRQKIFRDYHKARPRMTEDLTDTMIRAANSRNAKRAEDGPTHRPDGPSIRPLRSTLEDQLIGVQEAIERPMRIAVGAESMSEPAAPSFARLMAAKMAESEAEND